MPTAKPLRQIARIDRDKIVSIMLQHSSVENQRGRRRAPAIVIANMNAACARHSARNSRAMEAFRIQACQLREVLILEMLQKCVKMVTKSIVLILTAVTARVIARVNENARLANQAGIVRTRSTGCCQPLDD
jgi:hypothetical protein